MHRNLPDLRLLRLGGFPARPVGEEPVHQAAFQFLGRSDDIVLCSDGSLNGAECSGDAALLG